MAWELPGARPMAVDVVPTESDSADTRQMFVAWDLYPVKAWEGVLALALMEIRKTEHGGTEEVEICMVACQ